MDFSHTTEKKQIFHLANIRIINLYLLNEKFVLYEVKGLCPVYMSTNQPWGAGQGILVLIPRIYTRFY